MTVAMRPRRRNIAFGAPFEVTMQVFDAEPTDARLARLVDPGGRSVSVQVEDTPERLVAHPRGFPLWFVTVCVMIPVSILTGYLATKAFPPGLHPFEVLGLAAGYLAAPTLIAMVWWMNREQVKRGDFFVLDKVQRSLALPRSGVHLLHGQIRGFVEVHAWHTVRDEEGSSSEWLAELSVLARTGNGEIVRYPVIACQRTGAVRRLGESLAQFFGVERRALTLNWRTRRRLKAERG
jgi:hypothetical protein